MSKVKELSVRLRGKAPGHIPKEPDPESDSLTFSEIDEKEKEEKRKRELREKLKKEMPEKYIRVGDKFYKKVLKPNKDGQAYITYVERQKATIKDDHTALSITYIPKYEGFVSVPSHVGYQQDINGFFNEYHRLTHIPLPGEFPTIRSILSHIFTDRIEFILDYIQLLYLKPTQRLPIILLESKERNTGKSTFGNLLKLLFQDNAAKIGNSDLESDFNALWIKSLCIIVDETQLNKKGIGQMLKRLSTETGQVTSNEKNKAQHQVDFFGKFLFISNEEGTAMQIDRGENRYAVFKVRSLFDSGLTDIPNITELIQKEIPGFLHFLTNRKLVHQEAGRMYFDPETYRTEQLLVYYQGSGSYNEKTVRDFIFDAFEFFPEQQVLCYAVNELIELMKVGNYNRYLDRVKLKKVLEIDLGIVMKSRSRYTMYNHIAGENHAGGEMEKYNSEPKNNTHYEFDRETFKKR